MARYDSELLEASRRLIERPVGQRGRLPSARVRRSISTSYYALFHFLLEECGYLIVGTNNNHRRRRRILARIFTHNGMRAAFAKVTGQRVGADIQEFLRFANGSGPVPTPAFVREMATTFLEARVQRHEADYDLNASLIELDARTLVDRVDDAIRGWTAASTRQDRDFKHALCLLMLLDGRLRGGDG